MTTTSNRREYCKCGFTDSDGTFVPGEACAIHPNVTPQRTPLPTSNQCSHASIKRDTHGWRCDDCLRTFFPSGETGAERETVRLRSALQEAVNVWDNYRIDSTEIERAIKANCEALLKGSPVETTTKPARDAEHCDFPDCEQHWRVLLQRCVEGWRKGDDVAGPMLIAAKALGLSESET